MIDEGLAESKVLQTNMANDFWKIVGRNEKKTQIQTSLGNFSYFIAKYYIEVC